MATLGREIVNKIILKIDGTESLIQLSKKVDIYKKNLIEAEKVQARFQKGGFESKKLFYESLGLKGTDAIKSAIRKMAEEEMQIEKTIDNTEKKVKSFGQSLKDNIFSYKGVAAAGIGMLLKKSISEALDFNSIVIDIKKVKPSLEIDNIKHSLIELKKVAPGKSFEDLGLAYKFAVQNMKEEDVEGFLKIAEKSTIAFDMSAQETAESLTKLKTQYNLTNEEIADFSDKTAYAHHKFGTATVSNILRVQGSLAGMTQAMNVNKDSVLAWSTTLLQSGLDASTTASSIENMITRLSSLKGSHAKESLKTLGISEEELKTGMKNNPAEMINKVLMKMGEASKRKDVNIATISSSLFGLNYQSQAVYLTEKFKEMIDLQDKLQGKTRGINKELVYQGETNKSYDIKMTDDKMAVKSIEDNFLRIRIALGQIIKPTNAFFTSLKEGTNEFATALEGASDVVNKIKNMSDEEKMSEIMKLSDNRSFEEIMSSVKNKYVIGSQLPPSMVQQKQEISKSITGNNNYTFNIQGGNAKSIADEVLMTIQQMNRSKDIITQQLTQ